MWRLIQHYITNWVRAQFNGNPLIEQPGEYLPKVGAAVQVGVVAVFALIAFALIIFVVFVIGVMKGWF